MPTQEQVSDPTASPAPTPFPFKVLVRVPAARNIPVFALGVEKGRSAVEHEVLTGPEAVKQVVNGSVARALQAGRYGAHQLIRERRRVGERTALHSTWLAFVDAELAQAFVGDFPRLGLEGIEHQIEAQLAECEARLRDGLASGQFDLNHLDENARLRRAREYVALAERAEALREDRRAFGTLWKILGQ